MNCAGPWAAEIASMAGITLPVEPLRRMLVPTEPFDQFPHTAPMIIDMSNGFHFRPESRGFLLAWNDPEETPGFKTDFEPTFIEKILTRAADRVPIFENVAVNPKRAWAGLYEMTPDHHPILGESPEVPGFFFANGFSGHGVMHAPATGKILSDLILSWQNGPDRRDASKLFAIRRRQNDSRNGGALEQPVTGDRSPPLGFTENWSLKMSLFGLIEYSDAAPEVRAVYDDIMATRKTDYINNFWKALAHDPATLKRTWESIKQIMAPGTLDPLTKEMLYIAVSVTNQCDYCIASHTASAKAKGMTDAQFKELMAVVGMANETNRLVAGYQVEIDDRYKPPLE